MDQTGGPIRARASIVGNARQGAILCLAFAGVYPRGSTGIPTAEAMRQRLKTELEEHKPAGVILDLTELDYRGGDGLNLLVFPLLQEERTLPLSRPVCIVTTGQTADAIKPLLTRQWLLGIAGAVLFNNLDEGLQHIMAKLSA